MQKVDQALINIIGVKPTYMRPPYLATGGAVLSTMKTLGFRVITDDVDAEDWNGKTPAQSQAKFTAAGTGGNGHIPLMHETYAGTVNTLTPWLINWAKNNNLKLVTVGEFARRKYGDVRFVLTCRVAECLGDTKTGMYKNGTATNQNTC
jgi:peptidoglycan/xylan/chitin deacetylase (PgdA/CDA1 family)